MAQETDFAGLSEAEIAALKDDDVDEEFLQRLAGEDEDDAGDDDDAEDGADADESDDGNGSADEPLAAASTDEPSAVDRGAPVQAEVYQPPVPGDVAERMSALDGELDVLGKKLAADEIDLDVYHAQLIKLSRERTAIETQMAIADYARQAQAASAEQAWVSAQSEFLEANPGYRDSPIRYGALDVAVRQVAQAPESAGKSFSWMLSEAKRQVEADFGAATPAAPARAAPTAKASRRAPSSIDIPQTLGAVPMAASNGTDKDPFAQLDSLSGLELERAIAKLSTDQQQAYLGVH
jgi:hypothetical protein